MSYPSALTYSLRTLSGVSSASFRIPCQTTNAVSPNGQIRMSIPTNSIVDMRKCKFVFCVETSGTGNVRLPEVIALIQRYQVSAGGVPISQGCANAHVLKQALKIVHPHDEGDMVDHHPEVFRYRSSVLGIDLSGGLETYRVGTEAKDNATFFELSLGAFFDSCEPRMLSTDLLPQIEVELFLNSANVLISAEGSQLDRNPAPADQTITEDGSQDASYTISQYSLIAPCYALNDDNYSLMLDATMVANDYLPVGFKEYYNYSDTFTGTFQGSNGSSCLNRLIGVFRNASDVDTQGGAVYVQGYKTGAADVGGVPVQLQSSVHAGEKYVSKALNFQAPMTTLPTTANASYSSGFPNLVWRVNSVSLPNFNVPLPQFYGITKNAFDVDKTMAKSMVEYLNNRFVIAINLALPSNNVKEKSGLNMRGSSSTIRLESPITTNLDTTHNLQVFMETTAELRIASGKQLAIIN
jgi:hypothetical protein